MKKAASYKTTTYETGHEDFMIDVVEVPERYPIDEPDIFYEGYLYRKTMGVKMMVVGIQKEPGKTIRQAAKELIDYCCIDWGKGDSFDFYDKQYGD